MPHSIIYHSLVFIQWRWCVYIVGLKRSSLVWVFFSKEPTTDLNKYSFQWDQQKMAIDEKCLKSVKKKIATLYQENIWLHIFFVDNCNCLLEKFSLICHIPQILHLWTTIYSGFCRILLIKKISSFCWENGCNYAFTQNDKMAKDKMLKIKFTQ